MGEKTYELSGYESEMIKPKELIEIKEATEILLALYAPRHAHTKTVTALRGHPVKIGWSYLFVSAPLTVYVNSVIR